MHLGTWKESDWKIGDKEICGWTSQDVCVYYVKTFMSHINAYEGIFTVEETLKNQVGKMLCLMAANHPLSPSHQWLFSGLRWPCGKDAG